jgi:hypothetical protein
MYKNCPKNGLASYERRNLSIWTKWLETLVVTAALERRIRYNEMSVIDTIREDLTSTRHEVRTVGEKDTEMSVEQDISCEEIWLAY